MFQNHFSGNKSEVILFFPSSFGASRKMRHLLIHLPCYDLETEKAEMQCHMCQSSANVPAPWTQHLVGTSE